MAGTGGPRPGAGRKAGGRNRATASDDAIAREVVVRMHAAGLDGPEPLTRNQIAAMTSVEMMQYAAVTEAMAGRWVIAAEISAKVAPYRHARLSQVTTDTTIRRSVTDLSDEELIALAGEGESEGGDSGEDCRAE